MRENDVEILNLLKNRKHNNRLTREEENKLKLLLRKKECYMIYHLLLKLYPTAQVELSQLVPTTSLDLVHRLN